ncbi:MAG: HIT domain-containing protein [bacterium]|nr:HIT domain-containing protein [bacterium]
MKRLWAPWRMDFILGKSEGQKGGGPAPCVLCSLLRKADGPENLVLFRGEVSYVIMNKYPYTNGHLMVVPLRHVQHMDELTPEEGAEMFRLAQKVVAVLREKLGAHGFNVGFNLGKAAGAGIDEHLHMHIVPRWEGDHNFMPILGEVRVIPEHLEETYRHLQGAFRG